MVLAENLNPRLMEGKEARREGQRRRIYRLRRHRANLNWTLQFLSLRPCGSWSSDSFNCKLLWDPHVRLAPGHCDQLLLTLYMYLQLTEAIWSALVEKILDILKAIDVPPEQRIIICIDGGTFSEAGDAKEESSAPGKGQQSNESCNTRVGRIWSQKRVRDKEVSGKDPNAILRLLEKFIKKKPV